MDGMILWLLSLGITISHPLLLPPNTDAALIHWQQLEAAGLPEHLWQVRDQAAQLLRMTASLRQHLQIE
jgi:hypothetical protein